MFYHFNLPLGTKFAAWNLQDDLHMLTLTLQNNMIVFSITTAVHLLGFAV